MRISAETWREKLERVSKHGVRAYMMFGSDGDPQCGVVLSFTHRIRETNIYDAAVR